MKAVLLVGVVSAAVAAAAEPDVQSFLRHELGLSPGDVRDVNAGRAASRTLSASDGREVATAGAVLIGVPASFYVQQLEDIVEFKRSPAVLQIGTFSTPATLEDVADLTLPRGDIEGLRRCRLHDCNIQLSAEAIRRVQHGVDWEAPDAAEQANRVMRQLLVDLVNNYRANGRAAMMVYQDRRHPVSSADEFDALIADGPALVDRHPALRRVVQHPAASGPGTTDLIYWSREKVGPSEVVSVTHMSFARAGRTPVRYVVASKQVYGSRYFDASLGLTFLLHDDSMGEQASCLVYVNLSRVNALRGFLGGIKRAVVRSRTRSTMADYLVKARDMVERRFAGQRHGPQGAATTAHR